MDEERSREQKEGRMERRTIKHKGLKTCLNGDGQNKTMNESKKYYRVEGGREVIGFSLCGCFKFAKPSE